MADQANMINAPKNLKYVDEIRTEKSRFTLSWIMNNICTNHCPYCPEILHRGKNNYYTWEQAERFADQMITEHEKMLVVIGGGEPTVHPWFKAIVNKFLSSGHQVGVSTNAVRPVNFWQDCRPSHMRISYHPHYHRDYFVERCLAIWELIPDTVVKVMMPADRWDQSQLIYEVLKPTGIGLEAIKIQDWAATTYQYSSEQEYFFSTTKPKPSERSVPGSDVWRSHAYIKNYRLNLGSNWPIFMVNNQVNRFKDWHCNIGIESLFLNYDGSIKTGTCPQAETVGWIQDPESWCWPTEPTRCGLDECQCITDVRISKRKPS